MPEIADGTVEIVALAREAGHRTKIAVRSNRSGVNAKGVVHRAHGRPRPAVMTELHGEKIDIVDWSDDPAEFVAEALQPAEGAASRSSTSTSRSARVTVPDYQLSLAIGKEGQNAAARRAADRVAHRHPLGRGRPRVARGPAETATPAWRETAARRGRLARDRSRWVLHARTHVRGVPRQGTAQTTCCASWSSTESCSPTPGGQPGRGAYLHPTVTCLELAERRRAFPRALRLAGPLDDTQVRAHLEQHDAEQQRPHSS